MSASDYDRQLYNLQIQKGGDFGPIRYLLEKAQDNITAFAGGGQANATLLVGQMPRVTVVATVGDSVMLPPSQPGLEIYLMNHGANAMQVYGSGTDTIDDVAFASGVSQMASSMVLYACTSAGQWYTNGIGTGYSGSFPTVSWTNGITATAGGTQGTAVALATVLNRITTVATAGDAVKLPLAAPGVQIVVTNAGANSMNLFPAVGDAINGAAANVALAIPAGKTTSLSSTVGGVWHAVISA